MKKFLSLVLALVMTMSLVTVGAGAKDFTDSSDITYEEAVAVMSAVGVVDGYEDGDFKPTNTLTRGAAAKIICNMILGPTTAEALNADSAPFIDVPANHTFAGYIAYCSKEGIISGYADGSFRPGNTLTGYAFMKMLLGALGYDAEIEGYTGPNWSINVAKQALDIELDDGLVGNFTGTKALTREEACLYALNTMEATMVKYDSKTTVTVENGTTVKVGDDDAEDKENNTSSDGWIKDDGLMQFGEEYFYDDLKISSKAADKIDDFGRPATTWVYEGEDIGTWADDPDDELVINKTLPAMDILYDDSDYFNYSKDDFADEIKVYVNGKLIEEFETFADLKKNSDDNTLKFLAGDKVELYENDDDDIETIAVTRWSLAVIDEIDTDLSSTYTKEGASYSISLEDLDEASIGTTYYDVYDSDEDKELPGFNRDDYTEGTVIAVAMSLEDSDVILDSHVTTSQAGMISDYDADSKAMVTLDGEDYPLHGVVNTSNGDRTANDKANGATNIDQLSKFNYDDSTYTIFLDENGYVVGIEETEGVKIEDVYFVTGLTRSSSKYTPTYYAQAVSLYDGTVTEYQVKTDDLDTNKAFYGSDATTGSIVDAVSARNSEEDASNFEPIQGLFTFDKDGGKYTAKRYTTDDDDSWRESDSTYYVRGEEDEPSKQLTVSKLTDDLARDDTRMKLDDNNVYLTDTTVFLKVEDTGDDIDVTVSTGSASAKMVNADNDATSAMAVCTKSKNNYEAAYVILVSKDFAGGGDDVVFVAERSKASTGYVNTDGSHKTGYKTELYFLDGSGKVETVVTDKNYDAGFYTWDINDDDVYELDSNVNDLITEVGDGKAYDDQAGFIGFAVDGGDCDENAGALITNVHNNTLTVSRGWNDGVVDEGTYGDGNKTVTDLDGIDFAENVIVADDRGSSDRDDDWYTSEITSVSQLRSAVDKNNGDSGLTAVVYYDDEEVLLVYVLSMNNSNSSSSTDPENLGKSDITLTDNEDGTLTVEISNGAPLNNKKNTTVNIELQTKDGKYVDDVDVTVDSKEEVNISEVFENLDEGTYRVIVTYTDADGDEQTLTSNTVTVAAKVEDASNATVKGSFSSSDNTITVKVTGDSSDKAVSAQLYTVVGSSLEAIGDEAEIKDGEATFEVTADQYETGYFRVTVTFEDGSTKTSTSFRVTVPETAATAATVADVSEGTEPTAE